MIKRTIAILLCILLLLCLAACGGKSASSGAETGGSGKKFNFYETKKPDAETAEKSEAEKDEKDAGGKNDKPAATNEAAPGSEPTAAPEPADGISETMRQMAGDYVLRGYDDNADVYYDYVALENQRIVNGRPSGALTLSEDGTGSLRCLDREADIRWDEDSFLMDGAECQFQFLYPSLYIDTPDDERIVFSKQSHLDDWNQSVLHTENREVADAADYALGEPELTRYNEGKRSYILVRVPIENRSERQLVLEELFFTTCARDGRELGFFSLPAIGLQMLLPGEKGEFIFPYFVKEEGAPGFGQASAATFPENVVIRVDEADVFHWTGQYRRYEAEITEIVAFVDTFTGTYMVYRPNGYVELPEGTDIQELYVHIYCYDTEGNIIGIGGQFACASSVNPVNYFEEIPGEHRAKFQTNMNGPYNDLNYPTERIGGYVVVVDSPEYFY